MFKTINKNNWTGEQAKIRISESNNTVSLYGVCGVPKWETFKISITAKDGFTAFEIINKNWGYPLGIGYFNTTDKLWYAQGAVERVNPCVYTAVAQLLYMAL